MSEINGIFTAGGFVSSIRGIAEAILPQQVFDD